MSILGREKNKAKNESPKGGGDVSRLLQLGNGSYLKIISVSL